MRSVLFRRFERRAAYDRRVDDAARRLLHGYRDGAASRAHIEHAAFFIYRLQSVFDEFFRFGARYKHAFVDVYLIAVKLRIAEDVPQRSARQPLFDRGVYPVDSLCGQFIFCVELKSRNFGKGVVIKK